MDTRSMDGTAGSAVSGRDVARRGGIAAVVAVAVNVALVSLSEVMGVAPFLEPLSNGPVVVVTVVGVAGATLAYALLSRFRENPTRPFVALSAVVLLVSLVPDVTYVPTLAGATTAGVVFLSVMHVTTALVAVAALTGVVPRL